MSDTRTEPGISDLRLHTTDRQVFKSCRLRWFFSSNLRLGYKPRKTGPAFVFGSAWHAAIAVYYTSGDINAAIQEFKKELLRWYSSINNPSQEDEDFFVDSLKLGIGMLEHYGSFAPTVDDFETVWVERPLDVSIDGRPYSATPDALVRDDHGRLWIMEHKTANKLPTNTDYLLMDEQVGAYIWALHEATGVWAEGVIYTIARKKLPTPMPVLKSGDLSMRKDADTTYEYAKAQIEQHYGAIPDTYRTWLNQLQLRRSAGMENNGFFLRETVRRNRREIEILAEHIAMESQEMRNPDLPIYRNPSSYNCGNCAYVGPCLAYYEGSDWRLMLEGNYQRID